MKDEAVAKSTPLHCRFWTEKNANWLLRGVICLPSQNCQKVPAALKYIMTQSALQSCRFGCMFLLFSLLHHGVLFPSRWYTLLTRHPLLDKTVRLKRIALTSRLPCPREFPLYCHSLRWSPLICMVAALLPARGQEIGPRWGAKCAFNLNNPF